MSTVRARYEIFGVLFFGFMGNLNKLISGKADSSGWPFFLISLALSVGCIFSGAKLGVMIKTRGSKQQARQK